MWKYDQIQTLTEEKWNNAFAWEQRRQKYKAIPTLTIPSCIHGTIFDVQSWDMVVFEEEEDGVLHTCFWLKHFVRIDYPNMPPIVVFDNHNHALYFWIEAITQKHLSPWFEIIHIDEHSDLWENIHTLDATQAITSEAYAWDFVNLFCNVGNYILPAQSSGLAGPIIRIENEYQIDTYARYIPPKNSVLNIDLDFFAPELDHIDRNKKIACIRHFIPLVSYITIATSPFFISQLQAIQALRDIFLSLI